MSVTDTIALELLRERSTKIIHVHYLFNTGQGQSQQTALGCLRRLEANSPSCSKWTQDALTLAVLAAACCHINKHPHTDI